LYSVAQVRKTACEFPNACFNNAKGVRISGVFLGVPKYPYVIERHGMNLWFEQKYFTIALHLPERTYASLLPGCMGELDSVMCPVLATRHLEILAS
jgi:hypothetical protein